MARTFVFNLNISWSAFQHYYSGAAERVRCVAESGQELQIHARHFRPLLSPAGLRGRYLLELDDDNQVHRLVQLR